VDDDGAIADVDFSALRSSGQREPLERTDLVLSGVGQIVIDLDTTGGMTLEAKKQYKDCIRKYAIALAREASRLEEGERAKNLEKPEITATMVTKADDFILNPPVDDPSKSATVLVAQAVAFILAILTLIFGATLHSYWQWTVACLCGIMARVAQVYALFSVRRR
jgi:hypothetical protein